MIEEPLYDVVIIGAGVAGSIVAKYLTLAGCTVLVLEAGAATASTFEGYAAHLQTFYGATSKGAESAWPPAAQAPQPDTADLRSNNGYFVQRGPQIYGSTYTRAQGGSTLHWLGVSLRMLPEDFKLHSEYGVGRDWPIGYDDLAPLYQKAESELGVSADVKDQRYLGHRFPDDYDYPMQKVPLSYADQKLAESVDGMTVTVDEKSIELKVRSYPAARNSIPRNGYRPIGAVDLRSAGPNEITLGQRCAGNTSCTPICPIQAKYNAGKTLSQADFSKLHVLSQSVASKINIDCRTGEVESITYQQYNGSKRWVRQARGRRYVLAAHAVENARLMLASGLTGSSNLIGKHLMDHPALYSWGLAPDPVYPFRGPLSTAGIEDLRGGGFRRKHAAFRYDIGNDGWRATTGAPDSTVADLVSNQKLFGRRLRDELASTLSRQVRFSLAVEQLPDPGNRVEVDPGIVDSLGNPRPIIHYKIDEYTLAGMTVAQQVCGKIFRQAGIQDSTDHSKSNWFPSVNHGGQTFFYHGMGHFAGTHVMGEDPQHSVVNRFQRSWDHRNLFLVGTGSFPTMGTSNPTLTLSALAIGTAEHLIAELKEA